MSSTYQCQENKVVIEPDLLEQHCPRVEAKPDNDGCKGQDEDDDKQSKP